MFDLEVEDDIICRVIREVQDKKQKVSLMHNGQYPVLSVGNPMYTNDPSTDRIVIASRDLTEVARLQGELEKQGDKASPIGNSWKFSVSAFTMYKEHASCTPVR